MGITMQISHMILSRYLTEAEEKFKNEGYSLGAWLLFDIYTGANQIKITCECYPTTSVINDGLKELSKKYPLSKLIDPLLSKLSSENMSWIDITYHEIFHVPGKTVCDIILYYVIPDATKNKVMHKITDEDTDDIDELISRATHDLEDAEVCIKRKDKIKKLINVVESLKIASLFIKE